MTPEAGSVRCLPPLLLLLLPPGVMAQAGGLLRLSLKENRVEFNQDLFLGFLFFVIAIVAVLKLRRVIHQEGAETAIKTFYALILLTAGLRSLWFFIPPATLDTAYAPVAVWAFRDKAWAGTLFSEVLETCGSLCICSIFMLIVIYWADLLKTVFKDVPREGRDRNREPMKTLLSILSSLATIEGGNFLLFSLGLYSSQVMVLVDSVMLAMLSIVCAVELTIFSHRFRTVLTTLGAINQVPTDSQVSTIVWITVFGTTFFVIRTCMEVVLAITFIVLWREQKPLTVLSSSFYWDIYVLLKYLVEVVILFLMLYFLQGRKNHNNHHHSHNHNHNHRHKDFKPNRKEYQEVKDVENGIPLQYQTGTV